LTVVYPKEVRASGALLAAPDGGRKRASLPAGRIAVETPCANVGATAFIPAGGMILGSI